MLNYRTRESSFKVILLSHTFLYRAMISPFGLNILHVLYNLSDPGIVSGNEPETTQNLNIYKERQNQIMKF